MNRSEETLFGSIDIDSIPGAVVCTGLPGTGSGTAYPACSVGIVPDVGTGEAAGGDISSRPDASQLSCTFAHDPQRGSGKLPLGVAVTTCSAVPERRGDVGVTRGRTDPMVPCRQPAD